MLLEEFRRGRGFDLVLQMDCQKTCLVGAHIKRALINLLVKVELG